MKGYIYLPEAVKHYLTDRLDQLFRKVAKELNFHFEYNSNPQVPLDADVVLFYAQPYHSWGEAGGNIYDLPKSVKVIQVLADIWSHDNKDYLTNAPRMYERCDVLLTACDEGMKNLWPDFYEKCEYFPNYVSPDERWNKWEIRAYPELKMSFSGHTLNWFYPLRDYALKNLDPNKYFRPEHPGYHPTDRDKTNENPNLFVDDKYAQLLHKYFCGLSSHTIHKFLTFKFLEIASTGSLVLSNNCADMNKAGFFPSVHFVDVNKDNLIDMLDYVLTNPEKFTEMRQKAQQVVLDNHLMSHRVKQIVDVVKRVIK